MYLCPSHWFHLEKDILICLGFHLRKYSHMCMKRVYVSECAVGVLALRATPSHPLPWEEGFSLEPFQLLMHYRQIGPQIGLFAVDWHHTEMTSPLKWRGPPLTLWPLLKRQLQYNSFMSGYGFNLLNNTRVLHLPLEKWMSPTSNQGASGALLRKNNIS